VCVRYRALTRRSLTAAVPGSDRAQTVGRRRGHAAASPLMLPAQRAAVRVAGPGTRFEARVSRWRGAENILGERHPGAQTLL
jgi:hypothetical protein